MADDDLDDFAGYPFFMEIFSEVLHLLSCLLIVCSSHLLLAGGHMLLKDAVLDLRKGRRYGVVFCPPTREGSSESSVKLVS